MSDLPQNLNKHFLHAAFLRFGDSADLTSEAFRAGHFETRHLIIQDGVIEKHTDDRQIIPIGNDETGMAKLREIFGPDTTQLVADLDAAHRRIDELEHIIRAAIDTQQQLEAHVRRTMR